MNSVGIFNVAVAVVIQDGNKILITRRSPGREHAPNEWEAGITGRVMQGETCEEAALRETKEELGIAIKLITPFKTFHFYRGKEKAEHLGVNFWALYTGGDIVLNRDEQTEYKWVTPNEAFAYITDPNVIEELQGFIAFKNHYHLD